MATIGYSLPILALFVVKALDVASYTYTNLMVIIFWVALSRLVSYAIIKKKTGYYDVFCQSGAGCRTHQLVVHFLLSDIVS